MANAISTNDLEQTLFSVTDTTFDQIEPEELTQVLNLVAGGDHLVMRQYFSWVPPVAKVAAWPAKKVLFKGDRSLELAKKVLKRR